LSPKTIFCHQNTACPENLGENTKSHQNKSIEFQFFVQFGVLEASGRDGGILFFFDFSEKWTKSNPKKSFENKEKVQGTGDICRNRMSV
jgi:hypothetical protein